MIEKIEQRKATLEQELAKGQEQLTNLTVALETTKADVYRIQGAIALCKELLEPKPEAVNKRNGIPTEITGG